LGFSDEIREYMPDTPCDFAKFSSDELIQFQKENYAGSKDLRHEMCALLDNRLARKITKEEFDLQRTLINDNVLVLKQRRTALGDERLTRMRRNPRFAHPLSIIGAAASKRYFMGPAS
jgi:hypothetical protein